MRSALCDSWGHFVCVDARNFHPDCDCPCHATDWTASSAIPRPTPTDQADAILDAYPTLTIRRIAQKLEISPTGVRGVLKRHHVVTTVPGWRR